MMTPLRNALKSATALAGFFATSLALIPTEASSQTMPACPATGSLTNFASYTSGCMGTPEVYGITFYEMGLCTNDPMGSGTLDKSTCTASFEDSTGIYKDIAGTSVELGAGTGGVRPPNGTYKYAYAIISNTFRLRGNYATSSQNYYSSSDYSDGSSNVTAGATSLAQEFEDNLTTFGGSSCTTTGSETFSNGTMTAYVLTSDLAVASGCTGVSRLIGYMTLNTPLKIGSTTEGIKMTFKVANSGMSVMPSSDGSSVFALASGPFSASFTVIE